MMQAGIQNANAGTKIASTKATVPQTTGQTYVPYARGAAASSALPVPCSNNFLEDANGVLTVNRAGAALATIC
jgi:hypothetical protein